MQREGEDKELHANNVEIKESQIDKRIKATGCPDAWNHRDYQGRVCPSCGRSIPGGGMYTPAQMAAYFPRGMILEQPRDALRVYITDAVEKLRREYEVAQQTATEALVAIRDLKRARSTIPRGIMVDGQQIDVSGNARSETYRLDAQILDAQKRYEVLRTEAEDILILMSRVGAIGSVKEGQGLMGQHARERLVRQAAIDAAEAETPAPRSSLMQRAGAVLRGGTS